MSFKIDNTLALAEISGLGDLSLRSSPIGVYLERFLKARPVSGPPWVSVLDTTLFYWLMSWVDPEIPDYNLLVALGFYIMLNMFLVGIWSITSGMVFSFYVPRDQLHSGSGVGRAMLLSSLGISPPSSIDSGAGLLGLIILRSGSSSGWFYPKMKGCASLRRPVVFLGTATASFAKENRLIESAL